MYQANANRYDTMEYNRCGKSGLKLSLLSLGLWHNFGTTSNFENMKNMCTAAFDAGITHFDLADNYGPVNGAAEENFGRILDWGLRPYRDEIVVSTKAGHEMWPGPYGDWGSKKHLVAGLDQSLKRMKLDYVDIFYHHRPDPNTPLEETMLALDGIVRSGKALYVGLSKYDCEQTEAAVKILTELKTPFIIHQDRYSLFERTIEKNGLKQYIADHGYGMIVFSPLAQGMLTDKYLHGIPEDSRIKKDGRFLKESAITEERLQQIAALNDIAANRGQTLAQMALSWVLRDGVATTVLIGASRPEQILENVKIVGKTNFTADELEAIEKICG